jgi:hypothetical protein
MNFLILALASTTALASANNPITFNRDVLPILQKHCQTCHRPGQVAPMPLLTYATTRPWAKAIKTAVLSRKMPPWFADPRYGHFANDPSLSQNEIETLAKWADSGAPEGDAHDAPAPIQWPDEGWQIKPDVVISTPPYRVPAKGSVDWTYVTVPSGFTKDTWVTSIEILPGDPSVLHHAAVFFEGGGGSIQAVYVPGFRAMDYARYHAAKLIRAKTDLTIQAHYTPNGHEVTEVTRIGFTLAKEKPKRRFITYSPQTPAISSRQLFRIPAGNPNWESPPVDGVFNRDAELVWFMPHMHLRGKDMTYTLTHPDGRTEIPLSVPKYNFGWQLGYDLATPIHVEKGTRLHVSAHYDNSANNPFNPDPTSDVYGGKQTWEEMMTPFFGVVVDAGTDPRKVMTLPGQVGPGGG